jgi:hypothetical protein
MAPITAVGFIVAGAPLWLGGSGPARAAGRRHASQLLGLLLALIARPRSRRDPAGFEADLDILLHGQALAAEQHLPLCRCHRAGHAAQQRGRAAGLAQRADADQRDGIAGRSGRLSCQVGRWPPR